MRSVAAQAGVAPAGVYGRGSTASMPAEVTQWLAPVLRRACDVNDAVDNLLGLAVGAVVLAGLWFTTGRGRDRLSGGVDGVRARPIR